MALLLGFPYEEKLVVLTHSQCIYVSGFPNEEEAQLAKKLVWSRSQSPQLLKLCFQKSGEFDGILKLSTSPDDNGMS